MCGGGGGSPPAAALLLTACAGVCGYRPAGVGVRGSSSSSEAPRGDPVAASQAALRAWAVARQELSPQRG